MKPELFFGGIHLHSYTFFILLSLVIGAITSSFMLRKRGFILTHRIILYGVVLITFFVGARIWNILIYAFEGEFEWQRLFNWKLANFSLVGGMLLSLFAAITVVKSFKYKLPIFLDAITIPFLLSFATMRMGCLLNGCCFGKTTQSFLGIQAPYKINNALQEGKGFLASMFKAVTIKVWPTQIFEAVFALLFIPFAVYFMHHHKIKEGTTFVACGIYFSAVRWGVLYFRELPYDPVITIWIYPLIYGLLIVIGLTVLLLGYKRHRE